MRADAPSRHTLLPALDTERPISGTYPHPRAPAGRSAYSLRLHSGIRAAWAIAHLGRGLAYPGEGTKTLLSCHPVGRVVAPDLYIRPARDGV